MSVAIQVECDEADCFQTFVTRQGTSGSYARLLAREVGWATTKTRPPRDYCPAHAARKAS